MYLMQAIGSGENSDIVTEPLNNPFPGTVVSVEINTADTHTYLLTSEIKAEDIF